MRAGEADRGCPRACWGLCASGADTEPWRKCLRVAPTPGGAGGAAAMLSRVGAPAFAGRGAYRAAGGLGDAAGDPGGGQAPAGSGGLP